MWTRIGIIFVISVSLYNQIQCKSANLTESKGVSQGFGMQFRLPFIDVDIQSVSNLKTIKDSAGQQLFILHGAEFYQVILEQNTKRLVLIAILNGDVREADLLGGEIISWNKYVLLVIATEDHLEVYQFAKKTIEDRASNHDENAVPLEMDPIQQITIYGQYRGLYLFSSTGDSVTLIVFVGYTKLYSRLSKFEWTDTVFEVSEEKTISPVQRVFLIGSSERYLIATRMSKSQNTLSVLVFEVSSSIEEVQTMQLPAKSVQAFTYQGRSYFIACSLGQKKCTFFKMKGGQFVVSKKRSSNEIQFDKISAGDHFIVGQKGNDVSVYVNARMDCYGMFKSDTNDVTKILTYTNVEGNEFIVLSYIRPLTALIRIVEVEHETGRVASNETVEDVDELGSALKQQKHAFEESINKLRGILLNRKYLLDEIKQSMALIRARTREIAVNRTLHIESGKIGIVKIVGSKLRSPVQIMEKVNDLKKGNIKSRVSRNQGQVNESFTSDLKVRKLRVGNLIYNGVLLEGFNLNADGSVLKIRAPVVTNILETKELLTATVMESRAPRQFYTRSAASSRRRIRKLRVNRINDVSWNEFYESLFLRSRDRTIHGRLIMQSSLEVEHLTTTILNGMQTDKIFNLIEEQNITSDIVISSFLSNDMTVGRLNGLDFARDVARNGADNFILSPVLAQDISVTGKFILSERDQQARHIFGTSALDFQQIYTGRVIIDGSLTLKNLDMDAGSRMLVNGREVPSDFASHFWMYSMPQTFNVPIRFENCQVSAPTLNTLHLNGHPVSSYLLSTGQQNVENVLLIFLSAQIDGNLIGDPAFRSKLRRISENALRVGEPMIVSGEKVFLGSLMFDHGVISTFNDLPTSDLVSRSEQSVVFTGTKTFKTIHVIDEAEISHHLSVTAFNGGSSEDQFPTEEHRFGTVVFTSPLKAKNIVFNYLNGFAAKKVFSGIETSGDKIALHKDLFIEGNAFFQSNLQVNMINSIVWNEYLQSVVRTNENTLIRGLKTFASSLKIVSELETPFINDLEMDSFFKNYLSKSRIQDISGNYSFGNLQLANIDVPFINGLSTNEFIDTRSPQVIFSSELVVKSLEVRGGFYGDLGVDLQSFVDRIESINYESIKHLHVLGNAYWPWGEDQQSLQFQFLFENAVRRGDDQVITGKVKLKKPLINMMKTKYAFPKDIDMNFIANDCLMRNTSVEEVVMATKIFQRPVEVVHAKAKSLVEIRTVNRVNIVEFNSSIYRLSHPVPLQGPLTFEKPPIFGFLNVEGKVNGMPPDAIFLAYEGNKWPPTTFNRLHVKGDLRLNDIDNINLDFLLANRVRKSGPAQEVFGHLTFDQLVVEKDFNIQSINNIKIDNVVYRNSHDLQEISGEKTISGEVQLLGPTVVGRLNGEDIIERYRKTIFLDRNYNFDSLSIERAEFTGGLIVNGNSYSDHVKGSSEDEVLRKHELILKHIEANLDETQKFIETKTPSLKRLSYLDYDFSAVTEWKTANDSIQEVFTFDNNRYQYCDREQTIIKWSRYHNRFYISKTITNTVRAVEYGTEVTAENACKDGYRNVHSLITITEPHFTKQLKINNLVQSIEIYYAGGIYILFHVIDMYAGNNEIRTLKIDNNLKTIQDWQLLTDGIGKTSKLFKMPSHTILVVSTVIANYPSIAIYSLNIDSQVFEMTQVVDGDFDIIDLAQMSPHKYHLFLSCVRCQRIVIFEYDSLTSSVEDCQMYHIYQVIKLKTRIDRFNLFTLPDGGMYLLVLPDQNIDFYHVYKYRYIQGWKHFTYGYFNDIQNAYPLLRDGMSIVDDNLLLLCNRKCTLVKAYYQG